MKIESRLDQIHNAALQNRYLQLLTAFTRVLLAICFIPPSIPKIMGKPFTSLPDSNPVGHFFSALLQTGFFYRFIGWAQITAAVLLIVPRTSHIGALIFFPIILNIMILTNAVGFTGTWLITILMFAASLYLVCWDYDRLKPIFFSGREVRSGVFRYEIAGLPLLFAGGAVAAYVTLGYFLLQTLAAIKASLVLILAGCGLLFGLAVAVHHRFMRVGPLEKKVEKL